MRGFGFLPGAVDAFGRVSVYRLDSGTWHVLELVAAVRLIAAGLATATDDRGRRRMPAASHRYGTGRVGRGATPWVLVDDAGGDRRG